MTVMLTQPVYCAENWEVSVQLHPDTHAPRLCRRAVGCALREYGPVVLVESAGLVTSELVTNAVRHGRGPLALRFAWYAVRARLRVTVWDEGTGRAPVRPVRPPDDSERGRGLLIVAALSADWGQYSTPGDGKALWAELAAVPG
jgi:hypothetical protein